MRWRRVLKGAAIGVGAVAAGLWLNNSNFFAAARQGPPVLLAHRGLAQQFDREGLTAETCTATRMVEPTHPYLENTIPSMRAAFATGADVVELDVHLTRDGRFAVFHDWTVDCRTEGEGVTRDHGMDELRALDVGYGYTADGGETFPFRGTGIGLMPTLQEVLTTFPERRFLVHVKSNDPSEGRVLADRFARLPPEDRGRLMVYGGDRPIAAFREALPDVSAMSARQLKSCVIDYALLGWSGHVPEACRRSVLLIPINVAPWLWGWPDVFLNRMEGAGSAVFVAGPWDGGDFSTGIDNEAELARLPAGFTGGIWTNRAELIAPLLGQGREN